MRLAPGRDQAQVDRLLVGVLLAGILAFRSIELADRLSADFKHPVLDAVLLVFTGADSTLNKHERALGQRASVFSERPEQISYVE